MDYTINIEELRHELNAWRARARSYKECRVPQLRWAAVRFALQYRARIASYYVWG